MPDSEQEVEIERQVAVAQDDDFEFDAADAGASTTEPRQCSSLRENGYVMLKGRPCKIVSLVRSKPGKHGHAKVHLVGIDMFTSKKYDDQCPSTHNIDVPLVTRKEYKLANISKENFLELINDNGSVKDNVRIPAGELGEQIRSKFANGETLVITVIKACGEEAVISIRNKTEK